jgi:putative tryptophan/tyrosine transport system substrate-binding protein
MKKFLIFIIMIAPLIFGCNKENGSNKIVEIVIFSPMDHKSLSSEIAGFKEGLSDYNWKDGDNINFIELNADGNWNDIGQILETAYSKKPDLVFVVTTPAAQIAAELCRKYNVPTIYGAVTDPVESDIVESLESSEIPITGVTDRYPTRKQCDFFASFFKNPQEEKAIVLYTTLEKNSQILSEETEKFMNELGINTERVEIEDINNLENRIESFIQDYSIVIVNGDNTIVEKISIVSDICRKYKIPLFAGDPLSIEAGAVGALGPDYFLMGKFASEKANRVLLGEFAGDISSSGPDKFIKVINTRISKEINFHIPVDVWLNSSEWQSYTE